VNTRFAQGEVGFGYDDVAQPARRRAIVRFIAHLASHRPPHEGRAALGARVRHSREGARSRAYGHRLSLINLAVLYQTTGVHTKAEPLLERALAIREKALGPEHPDFALSLNVLAKLYQSTGAYAKAEPLFERALSIDESNTARFLLSGDEARKRAYFQAPRGNAYVDASFALARLTHAPGAGGSRRRALDAMAASVALLRRSVFP
jgi:tetratricopeptide (TPR) repeat protein